MHESSRKQAPLSNPLESSDLKGAAPTQMKSMAPPAFQLRGNDQAPIQRKLMVGGEHKEPVSSLTSEEMTELETEYGDNSERIAFLQRLAEEEKIHQFSSWEEAMEANHLPQVGLPEGEGDSGGITAMLKKFGNLNAIGEFISAATSAPRVKRHNTSAWITGRVKNEDYSKMFVPIANVRSQHSIDGAAVDKTKQRSGAILEWLKNNRGVTSMSMETLNELAGSTGSIKVGWQGATRFITLDGVGRIEAIRQAMNLYEGETGETAALRFVEAFAVRLTKDEYNQLYETSTYFRDNQGTQLDKPKHNLLPMSAVPRLFLGTLGNVLRNKIGPKLPFVGGLFKDDPDRKIPVGT